MLGFIEDCIIEENICLFKLPNWKIEENSFKKWKRPNVLLGNIKYPNMYVFGIPENVLKALSIKRNKVGETSASGHDAINNHKTVHNTWGMKQLFLSFAWETEQGCDTKERETGHYPTITSALCLGTIS